MTLEEIGDILDLIYELIEKLERPKGAWIKDDMFECDQCHHRMIVGDGAYNYCPNCGADMRGKE